MRRIIHIRTYNTDETPILEEGVEDALSSEVDSWGEVDFSSMIGSVITDLYKKEDEIIIEVDNPSK